jgi:hypothetical protein
MRALQVASGDLEQAVGYLLMGEVSQRAFDYSASESVSDVDLGSAVDVYTNVLEASGDLASPRGSNLVFDPPSTARQDLSLLAANEVPSSPEDKLVAMGHSRNHAIHALRVAAGDLVQAANFLLMGNSRRGFLLDVEHFSSERSLRSSTTTSSDVCSDVAVASSSSPYAIKIVTSESDAAQLLQSDTMLNPIPYNPPPYSGPKPKIVSTRSFLSVSWAGPFCTCFAASKFLNGGVVSAVFLDSIMESGIELYRKRNRRFSIETVVKMYGRLELGIDAVRNGGEDPKQGVHIDNNLQHEKSIRKLMAACRNEQGTGWQVVILELQNDSFCTCLPPKGSGNKFWFFDFNRRPSIRAPGAFALVHHSLMQMEETIESIVASIGRNEEVDRVPFTLYRIKKHS